MGGGGFRAELDKIDIPTLEERIVTKQRTLSRAKVFHSFFLIILSGSFIFMLVTQRSDTEWPRLAFSPLNLASVRFLCAA